jgi:hypothetical protein
MASLDNLPADESAVLQLVLKRGRSYDEIARLLSIDRAAVRTRALAAFDALGPQTRVAPERRALITDYLLGQLPPRVSDETRARLAASPSERAWARVVASELAPMAGGPLPEIPTTLAPEELESAEAPRARPAAVGAESQPEPPGQRQAEPQAPPAEDKPPAEGTPKAPRQRRVSRFGGMVLIGGAVIVVLIVVIAVIASGGSSGSSSSRTTSSAPTPAASASTTAPTVSTTSTAAKVVAQINLLPPTAGSKAAGIAEVLKEGATDAIAIVAQNVPANTTHPPNAYAVWLYNSPTDAVRLGFVNPAVGTTGKLSTAGPLPANASHFKQLIITVETQAKPVKPGTIILRGAMTGF